MQTGQASQARYRPSVAGILRRGDGRILIGERIDIAGAWQFPQGGVDAGEDAIGALHRELLEEVALGPHQYRVLEQRGPYRYDFRSPKLRKGWLGQEQQYFLCEIDPAAVDRASTRTRKPEFRALRWIFPGEFQMEWLPDMKRAVYAAVLRDFFQIDLRVSSDLSLT